MSGESHQASWPVVPVGRLLRSREEFGGDLQLLSLSARHGVRERTEGEGRAASDDLSGYRVVQAGDFVVNRLVAKDGAFAVSRLSGLISPAYWVLRPAVEGVLTTWVNYVLRSYEYLHELGRLSKFMPPAQFDLGWEQFKSIQLPVPDVRTQLKIVHFLDRELAEMDAVEAQLQRILDLLRERSDCLLSGLLPERTPVVRLGHFLQHVTSGPRGWAEFVTPTGIAFFRSANLNKHGLAPSEAELIRVTPPQDSTREAVRSSVREGDILVGITGANTGWVCLADKSLEGAVVSQHVALIRADPSALNPAWLAWALKSANVQEQLRMSQYGGTKEQLSLPLLRDLRIPIPRRADQDEAVTKLTADLASLDEAHDGCRNQLSLLAERRQVLITEAVTGQLDVPGVAA